MTKRRIAALGMGILAGVLTHSSGSVALRAAAPQQPAAPAAVGRATLDKYCVTCHNDRLRTGGLSLQQIDLGNVAGDVEVWEKVVRKVRTGSMPPAGAPRPDAATVSTFA